MLEDEDLPAATAVMQGHGQTSEQIAAAAATREEATQRIVKKYTGL